MKRKTQVRRKPKPPLVSAKATGGSVVINVPIPSKRRRRVRHKESTTKPFTPIAPVSQLSSLYNGLLPVNSKLSDHSKALGEHSKALKEIKSTQEKIQNQLTDDALQRSSELVAINNLIHNKGRVVQSPSGDLTPSTGMTKSLEQMRDFIKANRQIANDLSTKRGYYTDKRIDDLQANRLQNLYSEVKRIIERLSQDPEEGYVTPTDEPMVWLEKRLSTGKKLGKEERDWLEQMGLLDTVPPDAFKTD